MLDAAGLAAHLFSLEQSQEPVAVGGDA